jgi:flavin reductase (DIM6/NTAB) family NADH-FMN oxidoreductase RutF
MSQGEATAAGVPASADELKATMRRWATGVGVVTIRSGAEVRGVTVNSFTSLSLAPPLISICLDRRARTHHLLLAGQHFCVNLLSEAQQSLSDQFAGRRSADHGDFSAISSRQTASGCPILDDCLAWLDCEIYTIYPAGDHTIFVGLVRATATGAEANPLLHHAGRYHRLADNG